MCKTLSQLCTMIEENKDNNQKYLYAMPCNQSGPATRKDNVYKSI